VLGQLEPEMHPKNNIKNFLINAIEKCVPGADAIKKFTSSLGIPDLGV